MRTEVVKVRLTRAELAELDEALERHESRSTFLRQAIDGELERRAQAAAEREASPAGQLTGVLARLDELRQASS